MKKLVLLCGMMLLASPMAMGQGGPYTISIGSGDGSLSINDLYSWGHLGGDTATYDPVGSAAATTIWNMCWALYDVSGDTMYFMDKAGFLAHTTRPTDGAIVTTATGMTNTGMTFGSTADLTANLAVNLTQGITFPFPKATFTWTFNNSAATAKDLRLFWFVDMDNYLNTNDYFDDYVGMTPSANGGLAIVLSNSDGSGGLNMDEAIVADSDTAPDRWTGISDNLGSSYYWSSTSNYAGIGVEAVKQIDDSLNLKVENDADTNLVTDSGQDVAGAMQWNLSVPTSGSTTINATLTWGPGGSYLDIPQWENY